MQHGKNISEGGVLETQFAKFTEHFTINKIDVYGNSSNELKKFVEPFGLNFNFILHMLSIVQKTDKLKKIKIN